MPEEWTKEKAQQALNMIHAIEADPEGGRGALKTVIERIATELASGETSIEAAMWTGADLGYRFGFLAGALLRDRLPKTDAKVKEVVLRHALDS